MTWQQVGYGVGVLYGLFTGLGLSARIGARYTIVLGLAGFALGNLLCGAAVGLESFVLGRFVDGFGKLMVMGLCRNTLYKQFDGRLLVAIGLYGTFAYATRNATPLLMAELTVWLSWRWMYWFYVPIALVSMVLVWRYFLPDRPLRVEARGENSPSPRPSHSPLEWLAPNLFVAWVVAIVFAFGWYRKWGGWSSNAFAVTVILCVAIPVFLAVWLGSNFSPDEHLKRLLRTRVFVLSMMMRGLDAHAAGRRADDRRLICHRAARLRPDHGRLADGADRPGDGEHHGPDVFVPLPQPSPRLARCGHRRNGSLRMVAVVAGQFHPEGTPGLDSGLLGGRFSA